MQYFLLQNSKIVAHMKMWTSLWGELNWGGNEILTGDIFKWFFKVWGPWKFPHSIPTGYCHVAWKEPSAARRVSYLLFTTLFWGIFFFFLVVYKGSKPSKLIYCVGSYHLLRVGKRITAPLNIRFQRETRNVMSLLSPLSSVHMYTHSSTLNMQQRTCI